MIGTARRWVLGILGVTLFLGAALAPPASAGDTGSIATGAGAARTHGVERTEGAVTLIAPPGAERTLEALAPQAQRIVGGVSVALGIQPRAPFRMVLIPVNGLSDPELQAFDRGAPAWAAGFMQPERRRGAIRLAQAARYPYGTPEAVLAHESAHLLIHDAPGVDVPLWFEEGVATWSARAWQFEDVFQLSSRLMTHELPKLERLEPLFHGDAAQADQAYAASFAFVSWSVARYGEGTVRNVLTEARTHSFERAWRIATGVALDRSESVWRRESLFRYRWMPLIAGSGSLWLIVMLLSALVWLRRRRRARALEVAWERDTDDCADPGEWAESGQEGVVEAPGAPPAAPPTLTWRHVEDTQDPPEPRP